MKDLGSVGLSTGGLSALESQLKKVQADAKSVVGSAKDNLPEGDLRPVIVCGRTVELTQRCSFTAIRSASCARRYC